MFATARLVPSRPLVALVSLLATASVACGGDDPRGGAAADGHVDVSALFDSQLADTALPVHVGDGTGGPDAAGPDTAAPDTSTPGPDTSAPCEGCAFAPCEDNADCDSGFCLEGPSGQECAKTCIDSCPSGYGCRGIANPQGDPTYVCVYEHLTFCEPCRADSDCELGVGGATGTRCVESAPGAGSFCRTPCPTGACPDGARCEDTALAGATLALCRPSAGECSCSARAIARQAATSCTVSNTSGTCAGERACAADGLTACDADEPAADQCNGVDDDCDGSTDEDYDALGAACDAELDADLCADGVWVCSADGALLCTDDASAHVELCNGQDDDCDGLTDEDFPTTGQVCDGADDDKCAGGTWVCDGFGLACDDDAASVTETCNGVDDDCDGQTDEDFADLGKACDGADDDVCKDGVFGCAADGLGVICADDATSRVERCNGEDDDCDTAVDEGFEQKFQPCDGGDADQCKDGQLVCALDGSGLVCNDDGASRVELCNNIDDDCDGLIDEDFPGLLIGCDGTDADQCKDGVRVCSPDQLGTVCTDDATSFVELCNDSDDDCDGLTDEDFPTKGQACDGAVDADLCKDGIWTCGQNALVCSDDAASKVEQCNGVDDDCDGLVDMADGDLTAPLNTNQNGACAGTRKRCAGALGFADDYGSVFGAFMPETPNGSFFDDNCDGLDGDEAQAVFVKAGAANNATCSKASPCGSVTWAIGKTAAGKRHVYIQAGTYEEVVVIDREVHLFGGFNAQWLRRPATEVGHKVILRGAKFAADAEYMTLRVRSATASISDLVLEAKSPAATERKDGRGLSSYVVHAVSSALTFNRVEFLQGDGATGAPGQAGTDAASLAAPTSAAAGGAGTQEINLCDDSSYGGGGAGASNPRCTTGTAGGKGGNGGTMDTECEFGVCGVFGWGNCTARAGTNGSAGSASSGVGAGAIGYGSGLCATPSGGGAGGSVHGNGGSGGGRLGAFDGDYWFGGTGAAGGLGKDGAGGGGGGGSGGCDVSQVPMQNSAGAGGGGGGAGGCRAQAAGTSGGAGGSSVGVLVRGGTATFNACRFVLGNGGAGGAGGAGGKGQPGGAGGGGGAGAGSAAAGALGGAGGHGGHAGGGGGGAGGNAWGVLRLGATVTVSADTVFNGGAGGPGGDGGAAPSGAPSAVAGQKGDNGAAEAQRSCANATGC